MKVLFIPTAFSDQDNAFYARHEGGIDVVDLALC
jgi:hypothetical protein